MCETYMLTFNLTVDELDCVLDKVFLSEMQKRIIVYRMKDLSIVQMADLEHCSQSKINREIHKIKRKLEKVI